MKIERANKDDVKALLKIEEELFYKDSSALSNRAFSYHLNKNIIFKALIENKVVAYILWLERKSFYRLYSIAISKEFQGMGIGKALLEYSLEILNKNIFELEVRVSNEKAIKLYEKFDFKKIKLLKEFYDDEDGLKMRLNRKN